MAETQRISSMRGLPVLTPEQSFDATRRFLTSYLAKAGVDKEEQTKLIAGLSDEANWNEWADAVRHATKSYYEMTAEEVYGTFLSALHGLEDDASIEGFSQGGQEHLRAALQAFISEYEERHGA
jgi:hypothetical protein